jgi:hypothetical protein
MGKDGNNKVDIKEFTNYFMALKKQSVKKNNGKESLLDKKLTEDNIQALYRALRPAQSDSLDLFEFT